MKAPKNYCCGSGVCIISDAGECWCGQVWDGEKMVAPALKPILPGTNTSPPAEEKTKPQS